MESRNKIFRVLGTILGAWATLFALPAYAEGMMSGSCPMCGAMGWGAMILGGVLALAAIAALIALAIFLVRRSRPPHSGLRS